MSFIDVRNWLLALDMPFSQFTPQTHNLFDTTLGRKENIIFPEDEDDSQRYARADPPPHQIPDI